MDGSLAASWSCTAGYVGLLLAAVHFSSSRFLDDPLCVAYLAIAWTVFAAAFILLAPDEHRTHPDKPSRHFGEGAL